LAAFGSSAVETVAVLVTPGEAASPTETGISIVALSAGAIPAAWVHSTSWPVVVQSQPAGSVASPGVRPAGSVSSTVAAPVVATLPSLVTSSE
jgi:hypothetical protein